MGEGQVTAPAARPGRPRRYDLKPLPGWASREAGYFVAALDELLERLFDLIADLSPEALNFVPAGAHNSIAMLTVHMAWAEANWVSRVTQTAIPPALYQLVLPGRQGAAGELEPFSAGAAELIAICRRVRDEWTRLALSGLTDSDAARPMDVEVPGAPQQRMDTIRWTEAVRMTVRGVLMHLIWHWTNHSGQVALLRRMAGARYQWTFGDKVG